LKHQLDGLISSYPVGDNTVVKQITDHRQVERTLWCLDVGYIGCPFLVWFGSGKVSVKDIRIPVQLFSHLPVFSPAPDLRQQSILVHNPQHRFVIGLHAMPCQPDPNAPIPIGSVRRLLASPDQLYQLLLFA
jgi:hypothetical protein